MNPGWYIAAGAKGNIVHDAPVYIKEIQQFEKTGNYYGIVDKLRSGDFSGHSLDMRYAEQISSKNITEFQFNRLPKELQAKYKSEFVSQNQLHTANENKPLQNRDSAKQQLSQEMKMEAKRAKSEAKLADKDESDRIANNVKEKITPGDINKGDLSKKAVDQFDKEKERKIIKGYLNNSSKALKIAGGIFAGATILDLAERVNDHHKMKEMEKRERQNQEQKDKKRQQQQSQLGWQGDSILNTLKESVDQMIPDSLSENNNGQQQPYYPGSESVNFGETVFDLFKNRIGHYKM